MNEADIFHQAMLPYGGRFNIDSDPALGWWRAFTPIANDITARTKRVVPRMPDVHFQFVWNPGVQAYAFVAQGAYFIGVYWGTMYLLNAIFSRMLCDRRILPEVGNVQLETVEPQSIACLTIDAREAFATGLRPSQPHCETRARFQARLVGDAFVFLMLHELSHIAFGHVDYADAHGVPLLPELGWTGNTELDCLTRQSWEVMADNKAVIQLIGNMPQICHDLNPPMDLEQAVFSLTFAICVFFRMFGDATFTDQHSSRAYPPFRLRQALCMHATDIVMETWPSDERAKCIATRNNAIKATEEAFSTLTGKPLAVEGLKQAAGTLGEYTTKVIEHCRSATVPELLSYSYDPLITLYAPTVIERVNSRWF